TCRTNAIVNGIQFNNFFPFSGTTGTGVALVRPYDATNTTAQGDYRLLNPGLVCGKLPTATITPAQATNPATGAATSGFSAPVTLCQDDLTNRFGTLLPADTR